MTDAKQALRKRRRAVLDQIADQLLSTSMRLDTMTDAEAAAPLRPDNPPLTEAELAAARRAEGAMAKPKQMEVPGTAPLTSAQMAQRQAAAPLRLTVAQKPCDVGLF